MKARITVTMELELKPEYYGEGEGITPQYMLGVELQHCKLDPTEYVGLFGDECTVTGELIDAPASANG